MFVVGNISRRAKKFFSENDTDEKGFNLRRKESNTRGEKPSSGPGFTWMMAFENDSFSLVRFDMNSTDWIKLLLFLRFVFTCCSINSVYKCENVCLYTLVSVCSCDQIFPLSVILLFLIPYFESIDQSIPEHFENAFRALLGQWVHQNKMHRKCHCCVLC